MIEVPWWAQSPSPYTLIYWGLLCIYGASKYKPKSLKEWAPGIWDAGLILGLVIFPIDVMWVIFQWLKFGNLYPNEWLLIVLCLVRNFGAIFICAVLGYNILLGEHIDLKAFKNLAWMIPFYAVWFRLAPDPSWTDWTFAIRFDSGHVWESFFISHVAAKAIQGGIFISLWKKEGDKMDVGRRN